MDLGEVAKTAAIIPEAKLQAFLDFLHRNPERGPLIDGPHPDELRLQGDIYREMPWSMIADTGRALSASFTALILNNTCDLQPGRSQFISIAPALDFVSFREKVAEERGDIRAAGYIDAVRRNKVSELFYINPCPGHEEGIIVFLDRISTLSSSIYERKIAENGRLASFTQNGFFLFLLKLTNHLARAETPDVDRVCA